MSSENYIICSLWNAYVISCSYAFDFFDHRKHVENGNFRNIAHAFWYILDDTYRVCKQSDDTCVKIESSIKSQNLAFQWSLIAIKEHSCLRPRGLNTCGVMTDAKWAARRRFRKERPSGQLKQSFRSWAFSSFTRFSRRAKVCFSLATFFMTYGAVTILIKASSNFSV